MQTALFPTTTTAKPKPPFSITAESPDTARVLQMLHYSLHSTPFGEVLIASTDKGICELHFVEEAAAKTLLKTLGEKFPAAVLEEKSSPERSSAADFISGNSLSSETLRLHLFGTPFQLKVWEELLKIPAGETCTYGALATRTDLPISASRAVGTAVGQNNIAVLVPCHRVVGSTGKLTGFRWGLERKQQLLLAER